MRFMVVASCERSAATLVDYCAAFEIVADVFPDAEAAMHALQHRTTHYELVVVDTDNMDGMGGHALCSWLRHSASSLPGWTRPTPSRAAPLPTEVVVLSAAPDPATCTAFGADRCLSKPLSPQCFVRALRGWLASRQQRS